MTRGTWSLQSLISDIEAADHEAADLEAFSKQDSKEHKGSSGTLDCDPGSFGKLALSKVVIHETGDVSGHLLTNLEYYSRLGIVADVLSFQSETLIDFEFQSSNQRLLHAAESDLNHPERPLDNINRLCLRQPRTRIFSDAFSYDMIYPRLKPNMLKQLQSLTLTCHGNEVKVPRHPWSQELITMLSHCKSLTDLTFVDCSTLDIDTLLYAMKEAGIAGSLEKLTFEIRQSLSNGWHSPGLIESFVHLNSLRFLHCQFQPGVIALLWKHCDKSLPLLRELIVGTNAYRTYEAEFLLPTMLLCPKIESCLLPGHLSSVSTLALWLERHPNRIARPREFTNVQLFTDRPFHLLPERSEVSDLGVRRLAYSFPKMHSARVEMKNHPRLVVPRYLDGYFNPEFTRVLKIPCLDDQDIPILKQMCRPCLFFIDNQDVHGAGSTIKFTNNGIRDFEGNMWLLRLYNRAMYSETKTETKSSSSCSSSSSLSPGRTSEWFSTRYDSCSFGSSLIKTLTCKTVKPDNANTDKTKHGQGNDWIASLGTLFAMVGARTCCWESWGTRDTCTVQYRKWAISNSPNFVFDVLVIVDEDPFAPSVSLLRNGKARS